MWSDAAYTLYYRLHKVWPAQTCRCHRSALCALCYINGIQFLLGLVHRRTHPFWLHIIVLQWTGTRIASIYFHAIDDTINYCFKKTELSKWWFWLNVKAHEMKAIFHLFLYSAVISFFFCMICFDAFSTLFRRYCFIPKRIVCKLVLCSWLRHLMHFKAIVVDQLSL